MCVKAEHGDTGRMRCQGAPSVIPGVMFTIGLLPVMVLGDVGLSPAGWKVLFLPLLLEFSSFQDGLVSVSCSHSGCLVRWYFFKITCIKSLFCYLLCELIGSAFAKFCVRAVVRAAYSEQTCGASFAAASVSHSFQGSSPGPHAQPSLGPSWYPCPADGERKHFPFGVHWNWGGHWYKIRVAKQW